METFAVAHTGRRGIADQSRVGALHERVDLSVADRPKVQEARRETASGLLVARVIGAGRHDAIANGGDSRRLGAPQNCSRVGAKRQRGIPHFS
jgi:hypothetical protein